MSTSERKNQIVAEFSYHETAEAAIRNLSEAKFNLDNLSIVGCDFHTEEHPVGFVNTGDRMFAWGKFGAFWGSIWGLLLGSAVLLVPGLGTLYFAGWLVSSVAGALEGAVIGGGIGALSAALSSIGIPENSVVAYEESVRSGKFLVIVRGNTEEIERAREILSAVGGTRLDISENVTLAAA